jgi:tetratricopeptide (TPR) repeat protein
VQEHVDVPDSLFEAVSGGEAWNEFRDQVNDLKLALEATGKGTKYVEGEISQGELKEILNLIDTEPNLDRREQIIRDMRWGWTYKYLREHILADQRNSGYLRIYWDHVPDVKAQTINRASQLLQQGQNAEALRLMQTVKDDPRGFNTMAVALYQTGDKAEALEYFRRAAANGNTEARENLRRLGVRK